jgi:drug/metabolite transporter (DMT)-like permease
MSFTFGLLLTVASGLGWVGADALRKRLAERLSALELAAGLHLCQVPILAVGLWVGSQLGESSELAGILSWRMQSEYWLLALPSIACNAMANLLFVRALQLSDLSLTIPYLSLTPVMAVFSGWLVVGEQPALVGIAGVAVIAIGALVLNPSAAGESGFHPIRALKEERGSLAMLGVACLWSVSVAFDKRALDYSSPMTHAAVLAVTGWLILDAFRRRRSSASMVDRTRPVFGLLMGTTLVITVALLAQLWAYHYVNVAYVEAIKRSLGMVGSVLIGWWFFNEASVGRRIGAVAAMAVGVCLILLGG